MCELIRRLIIESKIFKGFHWLGAHHFEPLLYKERGSDAAESIIETIHQVDRVAQGFAKDYIQKIAAQGGRERDRAQYEQILQLLSELLIAKQLVNFEWGSEARFRPSACAPGSRKDIEMLVEVNDFYLGYEVKSPKILGWYERRAECETQLVTRFPDPSAFAGENKSMEGVLLPRDNPVKDFLESADMKFSGFKSAFKNFHSILVIVGDEAVHETISALTNPMAGLFTARSFASKPASTAPLFRNIDAVIIVRHLENFVEGLAERGFLHGKNSILDYGAPGYPHKVVIPNPAGRSIPEIAINALHAVPLHPSLGSEYMPIDAITRIRLPPRD